MDKFTEIRNAFEINKDDKNAAAMAAYMRNQFKFYGLAN